MLYCQLVRYEENGIVMTMNGKNIYAREGFAER